MEPEIYECPIENSLLVYYALLPDAQVMVMEPESENEDEESWLRIKFKDTSKPAFIRFPRHTIFINREQEV